MDYVSHVQCYSILYFLSQKGRKRSWHTAKILDSDEELGSPVIPPSVPPEASLLPRTLPGDPQKVVSYTVKVCDSTEEGKASGSAGEKAGPRDGDVEGGKSRTKGRRGSRRRKKKEKQEGKCN